MKTTVLEIPFQHLKFNTQGCSSFYAPDEIKKELAKQSHTITGILTIEYPNKSVVVAKFSFSPLGCDGHIEMISGDYNRHSWTMKSIIVNYVITKGRLE